MSAAHWRCYLRLPPCRKWEQLAIEERNYLRCEGCGKEKWRFPLGPSGEETGEGSIKMFGRGFGQS